MNKRFFMADLANDYLRRNNIKRNYLLYPSEIGSAFTIKFDLKTKQKTVLSKLEVLMLLEKEAKNELATMA